MPKLPETVVINDKEFTEHCEIQEEIAIWIADYLSDKYGFCVRDLGYEIEIKAVGINWDMED